jgi:antitoxin (DNA-binding transcriptional repressor) of toxin-antitoxin stability system
VTLIAAVRDGEKILIGADGSEWFRAAGTQETIRRDAVKLYRLGSNRVVWGVAGDGGFAEIVHRSFEDDGVPEFDTWIALQAHARNRIDEVASTRLVKASNFVFAGVVGEDEAGIYGTNVHPPGWWEAPGGEFCSVGIDARHIWDGLTEVEPERRFERALDMAIVEFGELLGPPAVIWRISTSECVQVR